MKIIISFFILVVVLGCTKQTLENSIQNSQLASKPGKNGKNPTPTTTPMPQPSSTPLPTGTPSSTSSRYLILHDFGGVGVAAWPDYIKSRRTYLETLPIDGLAIYVRSWVGSGPSENITGNVMRPTAINLSDMMVALAPIANMQSPVLKKNFGLAFMGPGIDLYDDSKWSIVAQNMGNYAQALKVAGLAGVFLDNESYEGYADWRSGSLSCNADLHSLRDCMTKMRQRGNQIMSAMQARFPSITVLFFHDTYNSDRAFFDRHPGLSNVNGSNELMGPFLVGFVEAKTSAAAVIQGGETPPQPTYAEMDHTYQYSKFHIANDAYATAACNDSVNVSCAAGLYGFIPQGLRPLWSSKVTNGIEVRAQDYLDTNGVVSTGSTGLSAVITNGLNRTDEYLWLYMDVPGTDTHTTMLEPPGTSIHSVTQQFIDAVRTGRAAVIK